MATTVAGSGISFFAGLTDDPFFFEIPGFNRFVASALADSPTPIVVPSPGGDAGRTDDIPLNKLSLGR